MCLVWYCKFGSLVILTTHQNEFHIKPVTALPQWDTLYKHKTLAEWPRTYDCLCPKRYFYSIFLRLILSIILIEIWPKHATMTFTFDFNLQHFSHSYNILNMLLKIITSCSKILIITSLQNDFVVSLTLN